MVPTAEVSAAHRALRRHAHVGGQLDVDATSHDMATTTLHALSIGFLGGVTTSSPTPSSTTTSLPRRRRRSERGDNVTVSATHDGESDSTARAAQVERWAQLCCWHTEPTAARP
jgi:hypothetical protein